MIKFVDQGQDGLPRKRKVAQVACESCRRRKKRCVHLESDTNGLSDIRSQDSETDERPNGRKSTAARLSPPPTTTPHTREEEESTSFVRGPQDAPDRHWIGDMNPESTLLAATSPDSLKRGDELGFWVSTPRNGTQLRSKLFLRQPRSSRLCFSDPLLQQVLLPYLEDQCLSSLPPEQDLTALCRIYQATVHPIFPVVVDQRAFDTGVTNDPASVLIKQSICLAACKDKDAAPHLRLPPDTAALQSLEDFSRKVTSAMRTIIDLGLVTDKRVLVQVYCLMSMFVENIDKGDTPAQYSSRAITSMYSLAVQILGCAGPSCDAPPDTAPIDPKSAGKPTKPPPSPNSRLFCCCWALDRINAALHGRAVLMHERDWTRDLQQAIESQAPTFQLFLRLVQVFDTVIDFYRPGNRSAMKGWDHEFPDFEHLVMASDASRVEMPLLATLEVLYHLIAILSHRTRSMDYEARSSASYLRRKHSASRITTIVGEEFKNQLPMLPTTPYAVGLCVSVGYTELRHSKIPLHQARARNQLLANCKILKEFGKAFWTASATAEMAEQLVHEVDRAVSAAAGNANHTNGHIASTEAVQNGETVPVEAVDTSANANIGFVEPTFPSDLDNFDIFDHFDPSFDLTAIDNAFVGNLDPSFPTSFDVA